MSMGVCVLDTHQRKMADSIASVETLQNALKNTQDLRASVSKVFQTLSDGKSDTDDPLVKKEKVFLSGLQQSLLRVNQELG